VPHLDFRFLAVMPLKCRAHNSRCQDKFGITHIRPAENVSWSIDVEKVRLSRGIQRVKRSAEIVNVYIL